MLADVVPQLAEADPSSEGAPTGGETVTAGPTLEQQGDTTREAFVRDARVKKAAALQDAGDERRMRRLLLSRIGAPAEGAEERTGLGAGYGVFDALYTPLAEDPQMVRWGRNYSDKARWTEEVAQDWESRYRLRTQGSVGLSERDGAPVQGQLAGTGDEQGCSCEGATAGAGANW